MDLSPGEFQIESAKGFIRMARNWEHYSSCERVDFLLFAYMHICQGSVMVDDFQAILYKSDVRNCIQSIIWGDDLDRALDGLRDYSDTPTQQEYFAQFAEILDRAFPD